MQDPIARVSVTNDNFFVSALDMRHVYGDLLTLRCLNPSATNSEIVFASKVQKNITVQPLPARVAQRQRESLWRLYSSCFVTMRKKEFFCFCVLCGLNGRLSKTKMRLCSETGDLSCTTCPPGSIVSVRMPGVVLRLTNMNLYMCPECTNICTWSADGNDLCPVAQIRPVMDGNESDLFVDRCLPRKVDAVGNCSCCCSSRILPPPEQCYVCGSKCVVKSGDLVLPNVTRNHMERVSFCSRHQLPEYLLKNVYSFPDLDAALQQHVSVSKNTAARVGKRF